MIYTTQHICGMFKVSHQTVKNWTRKFFAYLSPSATPEQNRQRVSLIEADQERGKVALWKEQLTEAKPKFVRV
jgi:hypothetical protein